MHEREDRTESYGMTAGVSLIVLMGLYLLFHVTTAERGPTAAPAQHLVVWTLLAGALLFHLAAVYWPPLRDVLGLVSLDADSWLTIVAASGVGMWVFHSLLQDRLRKRFLGV